MQKITLALPDFPLHDLSLLLDSYLSLLYSNCECEKKSPCFSKEKKENKKQYMHKGGGKRKECKKGQLIVRESK